MSCFLPNGVFFWSRYALKVASKWICRYPVPSISMGPALWAQGWTGNLGLWSQQSPQRWAYFAFCKKGQKHVSPPSTTDRARCCSEGMLSLPVVCLIIQEQHFKAKFICVVLPPCFLQAAAGLLLCSVKSLLIPLCRKYLFHWFYVEIVRLLKSGHIQANKW